MHFHEYQAKEILAKFGVPVTPGFVVSSLDELKKITLSEAVLKVQIHAGGRGKAGGVKIAKSPSEILEFGKELLGKKIINHQTGPHGMVSHQLLVSPLTLFTKEYYLGAVIDRKRGCAVLLASLGGGVEIEEIAKNTPEKLLTSPISLTGEVSNIDDVLKFMGWGKKEAPLIAAVAKAFVETDATLLEINPLVRTVEGELAALDAKMSVNEDALFRHPEFYEDKTQLPLNEALAKQVGLAYISLEGNIGCMVNGAGLAMATMDIIQYFGGAPANFLDVGGGASVEKIKEGFKILLQDSQVKAILVNIFGGIMNCETIAQGIIQAANEVTLKVPLMVRMEGTHVEKGRERLRLSSLPIIIAKDLEEAAKKVVAACRS